jgi:ceramide glucosyltransferase
MNQCRQGALGRAAHVQAIVRSPSLPLCRRIAVAILMSPFIESANLLSGLCVAGTTFGVLYNLFAAALVVRFSRRSNSKAPARRSVTVLKPLHGGEPGLFPRLALLCDQDYQGSLQLVCGTQDPTDHAIPAVRLLQRLHPKVSVDLVVDDCSRGVNRKVANLVNMEAHARHEVVLLSDSDIIVDRNFIAGMTSALLEGNQIGAATCVYYGVPSGGLWADAHALNINSQFLPSVIVALTFGAAKPCFGSAIAMRKETLLRIGGMSRFLDELADDYAIGQAIRAKGLDVAVAPLAVGHVCFERDFKSFWDHQMRAARTIRAIDPVGYIGIIFMHPLMLSVLAALAGTLHPIGLMMLALASRAVLVSSVEHSFRLSRQSLLLLILHDAISFAVFVCSFFGHSVEWRGSIYRILSDGTIENDS